MKNILFVFLAFAFLMILSSCDKTTNAIPTTSAFSKTVVTNSLTSITEPNTTNIATTTHSNITTANKSECHMTTTNAGIKTTVLATSTSPITTCPLKTYLWIDYDGGVLYELKNVKDGSEILYPKEEPLRDSDMQYTYEFSGWEREEKDNTIIYTAAYRSIEKFKVERTISTTQENTTIGLTYRGNLPEKFIRIDEDKKTQSAIAEEFNDFFSYYGLSQIGIPLEDYQFYQTSISKEEGDQIDLSSFISKPKSTYLIYYGQRLSQAEYYELKVIGLNGVTTTEQFIFEVDDKGMLSINALIDDYSFQIPDSILWIFSNGKGFRIVIDGLSSAESAIKKEKAKVDEKIQYLLSNDFKDLVGLEPSSRTTLIRAIRVHDYLVENMSYGASSSRYSLHASLIENKGVCSGYSEAFFYLMKVLGEGENVKMAMGNLEGLGLHSWNKVKVDGAWYNVDCTWDDNDHKVPYLYFMKSDDRIGRSGVMYESCTSTSFDSLLSKNDWEGYLKQV